jgi:glycosyltransferase involved in cell wall biosynthesis
MHVLAPASYGGLERVVQLLAAGQRARGDDVHVMALLDQRAAEPSLIAALRSDGVNVLPVALPPRAYLAQLRLMRQACSRLRPDVLHSHGYLTDVLAAVSARSIETPLVATVHGFTSGDWKNRLYEWMQCRAYRRFDAVVAVSRRLADDLAKRGVPANRLHSVPNAWADTDPPLAVQLARRTMDVPDGVFSIGWIGRVSHEKGLDVLIEALPALGEFPWRLTVLGDGRERAPLERRVKELGLDSHVMWRGVVPEASSMVRAFDLFVISSRTEGTPMTLFEAMSGEVPLVVTSVGGIPDVVTPAEAVLVPPQDPQALTSAIRAVHDDRSSALKRASAARARLRDFAFQPWLERYDDIYNSAQVAAAGIDT